MKKRRFDNVGYAHVDEVPMKRWEKPSARSVSFTNEVFTMAILTLVFGAMVGAGFEKSWLWMMVAGIAALFGLWTTYVLYLIRTTSVPVEVKEFQDITSGTDEDDPVAVNPGLVAIPASNGRSVEFLQPKPGEFANWAQSIIRDMRDNNLTFRDKTQLSQNTAIRRGWPKEMYRAMLASLRSVGWVTEGQNKTPVLTEYGAGCIYAWLNGTAPPHSE